MTHALHRGRPKRADLTTYAVLKAVETVSYSLPAADRLRQKFPGVATKVIRAAFEREYDRGNLNCGVSIMLPWLTDKGRAYLASHSEK